MPGRISSYLQRNTPNAAAAKSLLKNVAAKAISPSPLQVHQSVKSETDFMDLLKRHSISLGRHSGRKSNQSLDHLKPAKIDIVTESPPLVSFNPENESSGALFSGQFRLNVLEKKTTFKTIEVRLLCSTSVKKPVVKDCPDCQSGTSELKKWSFAPEPLALHVGEHKFPISYLFEGKMPATTHSHLCMLDYHWKATATTVDGETITHSETVILKRAICPGQDKQSIRVFPPTNISAHVTLNPVVHESGEVPISLRVNGIARTEGKNNVRWRLRRLVWRIEEMEKVISHACDKHIAKVTEGPGVLHEHTRTIGEEEVNYTKNPWKTDIKAGEIDAEFVCKLTKKVKHPAQCDVNAKDQPWGMSITHHLVLELVVVEESAPSKKLTQGTPTGAARILRSQFPLIVTNRAGLGISWDEETPPLYQEVPPSPPSYRNETTECAVFEVDINELGEDFEALHLGEALLPSYNTAVAGPSSAANSPSISAASNRLSGMSPRLVAAAMSPRLQAQASRDRSTSRAAASPRARPSSSSGPRPPSHLHLSADDLLQEPPEYRLTRTSEEDERPDVENGAAI